MSEPRTTKRPGAKYATDRFGRLFVQLLGLLFLTAFSSTSRLVLVLQGLLVLVILVTALRVAGTTPARMNTVLLAVGGMTIAVVAGVSWGGAEIGGVISVGVGLLLGVGVVAIIRRIFEHEVVRIGEVIGALAAYMQIALAFALVYAGIDRMTEATFFGSGDAGAPGVYLYFSVVTMTTLGYGDYSPGTSVGRSLVMIETLLGQIVLVVLVAHLVGSLGVRRPRLRTDESTGPDPDGS